MPYLPKFFKPFELVSKDIFDIYGIDSYNFLAPELLETLDLIREFFESPIIVNNWHFGGSFQNRGYRHPFCRVGARLSQHKFGRAVDFHSPVYDAHFVRGEILNNPNLFPHIYRMEKNVNWVHIDMHPDYKDNAIYLFNP